jgi:predicted site-specific integrase-resolvase
MQSFTHNDVFGHLKHDLFSAEEAAEFLEVSMPTFRRHVQSGQIKPAGLTGHGELFATADLRKLKLKVS